MLKERRAGCEGLALALRLFCLDQIQLTWSPPPMAKVDLGRLW